MPCWAGIRVGVTTRADAEAILGAHPWVGRVFSGATQLSWRWNGTQPALIDGARDGLIGLGAGVVQRLRIQTTVRYGEMWGALGAPDDALLVRPVSRYAAFQISMYDFERPNALMVISSFGCPVTPREFWTSTTTLGMGDVWTTEALNGIRFDIYEQPGWWGRLRRCRSGLAR
ncbi:MAG: hypothetical protein SGI73_17845 [Chloroflexota bacterium]|nr:hypothetical protein [Chloroflexota bacterium]